MGVNEFDEFPLPVPPLDDDPFTSLSAADRTAMEANDDDTEGGSSSEMKKKKAMKMTKMSDLLPQAPSFPFLVL
jgi:hypothetical protein